MDGGDDKASKIAEQQAREARQREALRQSNLSTGRQNIDAQFAMFDDPYYESRAKAYTDWANPQLETQANDARKALTFALSRKGLLNSTEAGAQMRALADKIEQARQGINSTAQGYSTDARRNVASARSDLTSLLNATEDPAAVKDEAIRRAQLESTPATFQPIGNLFADITSNLDRVSGANTGYEGLVARGSKLFQDGSRSSSGRVVA